MLTTEDEEAGAVSSRKQEETCAAVREEEKSRSFRMLPVWLKNLREEESKKLPIRKGTDGSAGDG
eukprot:768650-Hanusia_phi.AAC.13